MVIIIIIKIIWYRYFSELEFEIAPISFSRQAWQPPPCFAAAAALPRSDSPYSMKQLIGQAPRSLGRTRGRQVVRGGEPDSVSR